MRSSARRDGDVSHIFNVLAQAVREKLTQAKVEEEIVGLSKATASIFEDEVHRERRKVEARMEFVREIQKKMHAELLDFEEQMEEQKEQSTEALERLGKYTVLDSDGARGITALSFARFWERPEMCAVFEMLRLPVGSGPEDLFELLDGSGDAGDRGQRR